VALKSPQPIALRPTVVIGFAEAMAAVEAAWSLIAAGFDVVAFTRRGTKPPLRFVRQVLLHEVCPPEDDAFRAVDDVERLLCSIGRSVLLPLDDHALWVCGRVKAADVVLAGGPVAALEYALDKSLQLEAAAKAGFLVPPTEVAQSLSGLEWDIFPLIVKPARALYESEGKLVRPTGTVCADEEELQQASKEPWQPPILVQPLVRGVGEGLFGHVSPGGVVAWSAHRRLRMVNPQGSASSACLSSAVDSSLVEPAERFLKAIGWRGLFMLEFLRDGDGRAWFMELNGRAWGSMALARRRGFEYPAWTVESALDHDFVPETPLAPPPICCRNLGLEIVRLAFVVRGPQSKALTDWPSPRQSIRDVVHISRQDRLYNWKRSEPRVLMSDTWQTLVSYGRRFLKGKR
jgi:predicted ATP-grasp superfamily ATP-dependent carboligase